MVQFASCAAGLTGSCALADAVFQNFAKGPAEGIACAYCSDSSKSRVTPLPLVPPLFAFYEDGKVVGYLNGITTSTDLEKLAKKATVDVTASQARKSFVNRLGIGKG